MSFWTDLNTLDFKLSRTRANGLQTRFFEAGKGENTVLFLYGLNGHLNVFARNFAAHAAHYRVLAIDMIGHGYSDKPDHDYEIKHYIDRVLGFLDVMGVKKASLVGTSLGGWVSARMGARHPDRVSSISLVSSGGLTAYPYVVNQLSALGSKATTGLEGLRARLNSSSRTRIRFPKICSIRGGTSISNPTTRRCCRIFFACRIWKPACAIF